MTEYFDPEKQKHFEILQRLKMKTAGQKHIETNKTAKPIDYYLHFIEEVGEFIVAFKSGRINSALSELADIVNMCKFLFEVLS